MYRAAAKSAQTDHASSAATAHDTFNSCSDRSEDEGPTTSQPFERRIIMTNLVKTCVGLVLTFPALYFYTPIPVPPLPSLTHRLIYTLRMQTPAFLFVAAAVLAVSLIRLYTPAVNPLCGRDHFVLFHKNFLTNSVEQTLINVPAQLILASFLEESQMKVIPILVGIFVFGRVTFYLGYRMSYLKRTVGYTASFIVSTVIWAVDLYLVCRAVYNNEPIQL